MQWIDAISVVILGLTWGAQITLRSLLVRQWKIVWLGALAVVVGIVGYRVYAQYEAWAAGPPGIYFLPPYQEWGYFYSYVGKRIVGPWLIALLAAVVVPGFAGRLNKKYDERFFEPEETRFFALGIFLTGYPGFFFYLLAIFLYEFFYTLYLRFAAPEERAPLYFAWLPLAMFAILIAHFLVPRELLAMFNL